MSVHLLDTSASCSGLHLLWLLVVFLQTLLQRVDRFLKELEALLFLPAQQVQTIVFLSGPRVRDIYSKWLGDVLLCATFTDSKGLFLTATIHVEVDDLGVECFVFYLCTVFVGHGVLENNDSAPFSGGAAFFQPSIIRLKMRCSCVRAATLAFT